MTRDYVPTKPIPRRLVIVGDLAWRAKRAAECVLTAVSPWTWTR